MIYKKILLNEGLFFVNNDNNILKWYYLTYYNI